MLVRRWSSCCLHLQSLFVHRISDVVAMTYSPWVQGQVASGCLWWFGTAAAGGRPARKPEDLNAGWKFQSEPQRSRSPSQYLNVTDDVGYRVNWWTFKEDQHGSISTNHLGCNHISAAFFFLTYLKMYEFGWTNSTGFQGSWWIFLHQDVVKIDGWIVDMCAVLLINSSSGDGSFSWDFPLVGLEAAHIPMANFEFEQGNHL